MTKSSIYVASCPQGADFVGAPWRQVPEFEQPVEEWFECEPSGLWIVGREGSPAIDLVADVPAGFPGIPEHNQDRNGGPRGQARDAGAVETHSLPAPPPEPSATPMPVPSATPLPVQEDTETKPSSVPMSIPGDPTEDTASMPDVVVPNSSASTGDEHTPPTGPPTQSAGVPAVSIMAAFAVALVVMAGLVMRGRGRARIAMF